MNDPVLQGPLAMDSTSLPRLNGFLIAESSTREDGQTIGGAGRLVDFAFHRSERSQRGAGRKWPVGSLVPLLTAGVRGL